MECDEESDVDENSLVASLEDWIDNMQSTVLSQSSFHSLAREDLACIIERIMEILKKCSALKAVQTVCAATLILLDSSAIVHFKEGLEGILEALSERRSQHPQSKELIDTIGSKVAVSITEDLSLGSSFNDDPSLRSISSPGSCFPTQMTLGSEFSADGATAYPAPGGELIDLSNSDWIVKMKPGMVVTVNSDGKSYTITGNGKTATINEFEVNLNFLPR